MTRTALVWPRPPCRITLRPVHAADADEGAEFANAVAAAVQGHAAAGVRMLHSDVCDDNRRMAAFVRRHGFAVDPLREPEFGVSRWQLDDVPAQARRGGALSRHVSRHLSRLWSRLAPA